MKTILKTTILLFILSTLFSCNKDEVTALSSAISNINPTSGPKTTVVNINGNDFGTNSNVVSVYFNDVEATVQAVTDTQITAIVPVKAYTGLVKVIINGTELIGPQFDYIITDVQVSTFAGSTSGFADGQGTNAQFNESHQMVMDENGTIYLADSGNHKIRKITASGTVTTFAGSTYGFADGQGENAQFVYPTGIAIDNQNNIYVADIGNHKIRKITPNGVVSTIAGSTIGFADGQGTNAKFADPYGLAIDSQNNVYILDRYNSRVRKMTPSGVVTTFAGNGDGQGINAEGITIDSKNNIYVADSGNNNIRKITPNGLVSTLAGGIYGNLDGQGTNAQFQHPLGIAIDNQDNIYVADYANRKIRKITPNGLVTTLIAFEWEGTEPFSAPSNVLIDSNYDVYVTGKYNHKIRKITQE